MNRVIQITLSSQLSIRKSDLSDGIINQIRSYLTMVNPKYEDAEKYGYYTGDIEPHIFAYHEDEDFLYCYRRYIGSLIPFLCRNGYKYQIVDQRRKLPEINFSFHGELREYQLQAVNNALQKHFGIIVAPCGSGKTVMGLSIVAQRRQPSLIICHTKELLNQWAERITQYLGIPKEEIGIVGDGKESIKAVTVGMVQTLCKRDLNRIREHFGFLIVDEVHHTPASTFLEVVKAFDSYYMLGLSATPYRRDRLNKLIFLALGNKVAEVMENNTYKRPETGLNRKF